MALQSGGLIQDENLHVHIKGPSIAGKANALNSQRKSGPSGRKPLGDVSNSRKPVLNQQSKWQTTKNLTLIGEDGAIGKKKNILKGSENGARKVLSNISDSGKPNLQEASKKKQNLKLSTVKEEPLHHSAIYDEGFLHNHQECIKAQNRAMDMDQFLRIVGLDVPKESTHAKKLDSPLKLSELHEMVECWPIESSSSQPCKTPKAASMDSFHWNDAASVDSFHLCNDGDNVNFTLIKIPSALKLP